MKRRNFLFSCLAAAAFSTSARAADPWRAKLLKGGFDGTHYWTGLQVSLDEGWKTYWRVPGDGGVAPQIGVVGDNLKRFAISYPLPQRYQLESGEAIGYKHEVVFPIALEPGNIAKPLKVSFSSFIGVCDVICIPVQFNGEIGFDSASADASDQATISQWQSKVPQLSTAGPVKSASVIMQEGKPYLRLELTEPVRDIFVEGEQSHYFQAPKLMGEIALLKISGAKSLDELKAKPLRITCDISGSGLEQMVTVV